MSFKPRERSLPPISNPGSMGLRAKNTSGNRVMYSVEPLIPERASSVPLRSSKPATVVAQQASTVTGISAAAAAPLVAFSNQASTIDQFLTSSDHPSAKGIAPWKGLLETEKHQFHSVSMWGELMLQKILRETAHLPSPNPLRTAVCCMLLYKIAPLMGTAETLMKALLREVYNAIYYSWETYLDGKFSSGGGEGERDEAEGNDPGDGEDKLENVYDQEALQMHSKDDPMSLKHLVSSLNHRYTYFQLLTELQMARVQVIGLPSRVVVRCMDQWRRRLLICVFTNWRGETMNSKKRKLKIRLTVNSLFQKKCRNRLVAHFVAWRGYVTERRHRNLQDHEATQKKLQQRMGRRILQLEKENEELKAELDNLRSSRTEATIQITNMLSLLDKFRSVAREATDSRGDSNDLDDDGYLSKDPSFQPSKALSSAEKPDVYNMVMPDATSLQQNIASLFPELVAAAPSSKRRQSGEHGDDNLHPSGELLSVTQNQIDEFQREADAVASAAPLRLQQFKDFLDCDPLTQATPAGGADAHAALAHQASPAPTHGPAKVPNASGNVAKLNYADVLDWVSVRTQLLVTTMQPHSHGLRRCSNFTLDFRDSIRLACLIVSLGGDRSIIEDAAAITNLWERAEFTLKMVRCFFDEEDPEWTTVVQSMTPEDLVKGKGGKISKLVFGLYRKFRGIPVAVVPTGPPSEDIADRLYTAGGGTFLRSKPASPHLELTLGEGTEKSGLEQSVLSGSSPSPLGSRGAAHFGEFFKEEPLIPETQFSAWFRELADDDSDDDATNFFDVSLGGSVTGAVSEKMYRRMSRLSFHGNMNASMQNASGKQKKKSRNQELTEGMIRWVRQKISLQHEGKDCPAFSSMSGSDVLFCVLQSMFPKINLNSPDPIVKLKRMQDVLMKKLHLTKITLGKELLKKRDHFAAEEDTFVPLKELLLMLFFFDQEIVVNV